MFDKEASEEHRLRYHLPHPARPRGQVRHIRGAVEAARRAGIPNVCLISSVGCDYAGPSGQPRLREFTCIELESLVLACWGEGGGGGVAHVAAHVLGGKGKYGFDDKHRGLMMVVTGPMLCTGKELPTAASQALGSKLEFEDITESEAKKIPRTQSESDNSEQQHILKYYPPVREGRMNYISTTAFNNVTGTHPTETVDFFKTYSGEFQVNKHVKRSK
ncbi:hypothetical protein CPLU01_07271 [Colletotrichum plurivorum]|uniref:Uncharacterized protein n=1 Tax=Colletotrichum plurivorum TaxID=2175906 RepID=A0A8H6NFF8_9PEZI|nr:hypothetical protein CPLU01_07271 [Colletotrichum plurivorum]